jgi:DNA invertase Pin-like site-specific DNA recombinase
VKDDYAPTQIVGYYRVSTKEQGAEGLGMAAQRDAVARYAAALGLPVVACFEEVETGCKSDLRNRPQLEAALAHVRRSRALLVIARLDRLARNVHVTSQLMESGIEFVACDNPHASRLTIHILAAIAEHESRLISSRVKAAVEAARARGVVFKNHSKLSPAAIQKGILASRAARIKRTRKAYADLVPLLLELRTTGYTHRRIADHLNGLGHRNQFGNAFTDASVRTILRREGLGHLRVRAKYENHLSGTIQAIGSRASSALRIQRTKAYYKPYVTLLRGLHEAGISSVAIARELNHRGIKTQGGSSWYPSIVLDVLRREGIAPQAVAGRRGLLMPNVQTEGRRLAALRVSALSASHRGRIMPIVTWLRGLRKEYSEIAIYLNEHSYRPPRAEQWTGRSLQSFAARARAHPSNSVVKVS